jgi:hypothetical protein
VCGVSQQPHVDKGDYVPKVFAPPPDGVRALGQRYRKQEKAKPERPLTPVQKWRAEAWQALRVLANAGEPFGVADLLSAVGGEHGSIDQAEGLIMAAENDGKIRREPDGRWIKK